MTRIILLAALVFAALSFFIGFKLVFACYLAAFVLVGVLAYATSGRQIA